MHLTSLKVINFIFFFTITFLVLRFSCYLAAIFKHTEKEKYVE